ncbi:MAG: hypothetical protein KH828_07750 [Clostridiales bacterium]|nr:hypothetical protein [Clostridiales bacterium]
MREILFKAKHKSWEGMLKRDWWVEGYPVRIQSCASKDEYDYRIVPDYARALYTTGIDTKTLCRYTGLKDKDGKRIWENDITKLLLDGGEARYFKVSFKKVIRKVVSYPDFCEPVAKVELNAVCFEWDGYELFPCVDEKGVSDVAKMEVVGNIFDNPELLK